MCACVCASEQVPSHMYVTDISGKVFSPSGPDLRWQMHFAWWDREDVCLWKGGGGGGGRGGWAVIVATVNSPWY